LLSLSLRVMVPAGFMPAALSAGGPFVICPDGLPNFQAVISQVLGQAAAQSQAEGHAHHGTDHSDPHAGHHGGSGAIPALDHSQHDDTLSHSDSGVRFCPIGSVFSAAAMPAAEGLLHLVWLPASFVWTEFSDSFISATPSLYLARGPPRITSFLS